MTKHKTTVSFSPKQRRQFFLITISIPIVFFVLLEGILRIAHYGPDISMFKTEMINGNNYYILNPEVKNRYFSRYQFNATPSPDYFLVSKPKGSLRIFCLGGSTTVGYPYWYNGAFSTSLRDRLHAIFPDRTIEVINVGMTATNSFTVLDMAKEVMNYEPDLLIVYDGHNEFYGALGISSHESIGKYRWLTMLNLQLIHLKTFMLLRELYATVTSLLHHSPASRSPGTLMETLAFGQYIPFGSDEYNSCLDIFKENLSDLKNLCANKGIPVILGTQASNLRDMPPFVSLPSKTISEKYLNLFRQSMDSAVVHWHGGLIARADSEFRSAISNDSLRADAHYDLAKCLEQLHQYREARSEYRQARDYDQLRFRSSNDFNQAILSASDDKTVFTVDIEKKFQDHSPDSIIGHSLITEHLHPNSRGTFWMAKEYALMMRRLHFLGNDAEWITRDTINDDTLWNNRSVTDLDERIAERRTEVLTSGWPFVSQFPIVDPVATNDTLGEIAERVTRSQWSWTQAHEGAADYYLLRHDLAHAEKEYRVIINQFPNADVESYLKLAKILLDEQKILELHSILLASLTIQPTLLAYRALGDIALNNNRQEEAVLYYEKALSLSGSSRDQIDNRYMLAQAYFNETKLPEAEKELLQVLQLKPDYKPAIMLLQKINGEKKGKKP